MKQNNSTMKKNRFSMVALLSMAAITTALTLSATAAWLTWLAFFLLALFAIRKNSGKRRKKMLQWR